MAAYAKGAPPFWGAARQIYAGKNRGGGGGHPPDKEGRLQIPADRESNELCYCPVCRTRPYASFSKRPRWASGPFKPA